MREGDYLPDRPALKSAMMSSASSIPQLSRRNPSGMPIAARPSGASSLCEVSRGSETRLSTPARLGAWAMSLSRLSSALRRRDAAGELEAHHPAEAGEDGAGVHVVGMGGQAGVLHLRECRLRLGPPGDRQPVGVVPLHAHREGAHPPVDQPGGMRIDRLAPELQQPVDLLDEGGRSRHRARDHIAVAVEVLGGAGDDHVRPVLQRAEVDRAGEGPVHQEGEPELPRHVGDGPQVHHPHQRIGRGLHEDRAGRLPYRLAPLAGMLRVGIRHLHPQPGQLLVEEPAGPAVDPAAADEMFPGTEHGDVGQRRRAHAAGAEERLLGPLQLGVLRRQRDLVGGVAVPGIEDLFLRPDRVGVGAALNDGRGDGSPVGAAARRAVDGRGGEAVPPKAHAVRSGR